MLLYYFSLDALTNHHIYELIRTCLWTNLCRLEIQMGSPGFLLRASGGENWRLPGCVAFRGLRTPGHQDTPCGSGGLQPLGWVQVLAAAQRFPQVACIYSYTFHVTPTTLPPTNGKQAPPQASSLCLFLPPGDTSLLLRTCVVRWGPPG